MLSGDLKYFDYKFKDVSNAKFALYNLERTLPDQPLVLVEGTFDALSVAAVWPNVVASLGVSLTREKLSLLKNFLEIWVFFDNDKAGAEGGYKVKKSLKNTLVRMVPYTVDRKDPGSMSTEEIHQSLSLMETHK
jgi:DNA primase